MPGAALAIIALIFHEFLPARKIRAILPASREPFWRNGTVTLKEFRMKHRIGAALIAGFTAVSPAAVAQESSNYAVGNDWTYELQLYIWGTDVGGEVLGTEFELGFDQIWDNLNFALMGRLNAYNGPWMTFG